MEMIFSVLSLLVVLVCASTLVKEGVYYTKSNDRIFGFGLIFMGVSLLFMLLYVVVVILHYHSIR